MIITGTLADLYHCATTPGAKIVNALDFHPDLAVDPAPQLATDLEAFRRTRNMPFCVGNYPRHPMRWALAATKDARHFWHIDSDGFATYIMAQCGKKIVFVGKPRDWDMERSFAAFGDQDLFHEFDTGNLNSEKWDVEYIILDDDVEL